MTEVPFRNREKYSQVTITDLRRLYVKTQAQ